jgi:hypothetical protein
MNGHICAEIGSPASDGFWFTSQLIERGMVEPWGDTNALGFRVNPSRTVIIFAVAASSEAGAGHTPVPSSSALSARSISKSALIVFPYWFALLLTAILPAARIYLRNRAPATGLCPECSYNLTGNVSGVCPECGTPVPQKSEPAA